MPSKSRKLRPGPGLMLLGLLLAVFCISGAIPVAAQDSVPDRGVSRAPDHGGRRGGGMGGFGGGLGTGIGGALLEQMMKPRPASTGIDEPSGRKKKNAASKSGADSKGRSADVNHKAEPRLSDQRSAGGGNSDRSGVPPRGERRFVADELITEFSPSATPQSIDQIARRYSLIRLEAQNFPLIGSTLYRWRIDGRRSVVDVVGAIENERIVTSAQPNYVFTLQEPAAKTFDAVQGDAAQYVLSKLQIHEAHQVATGKNVLVAVIDSEIDPKHPDLAETIVKSFDALDSDTGPHKHGTAMGGAIASHGKLLGIAPDARLLAARAFDDATEAKGTSFAIYKGLQWATDNDARIVNMSFTGPWDPALHRMLGAAYEKDLVLVAAAGNAGPNSSPLYPAADSSVIAVTATDNDDALFKLANRGEYVAVAAPGVGILAAAPGNSYQITTGTSVAAAHVSGVAALLLQRKPSLKPKDIRTILMASAKALGDGSRSDRGAGLVNAYQAVMLLGGKSVGE